MATSLTDNARRILDDTPVATLSTLNADGSPQSSPLWVTRDGDDVLMSTLVGRKKERNLRRDPRASLVAPDPKNPYDYVEIRGTVALEPDPDRAMVQTLSRKYTGEPYTMDGPDAPDRVVMRLTPQHVTGMGG
jgi:PPOX class probable F420-dependent enzyme